MQLQADLLGRPVLRANVEEVGAIGVAAMAQAAMGHPPPVTTEAATTFLPRTDAEAREAQRALWAGAIRRARLA